MSTRKVKRITEELCGTSFSKSTVSALCQALDDLVHTWNERSLAGQRHPFVLVDALQLKLRHRGRVVPQSALVAVAITAEGHRQILGMQIADSESQTSWSTFLAWLKGRGLTGVELIVSDAHQGLIQAIRRHFQGISWQRCQVHLMRDILGRCPAQHQRALAGHVRTLFNAPDLAMARHLKEEVLTTYEEGAPDAMTCLDEGFEDAMAVMALPELYRRRLRSTNSLERLIQEVRRRERVIRIFPNRESALRLVGALLMEQDEEWSTGWRYFQMETYEAWKAEQVRTDGLKTATGTDPAA